MLDVAQLTIRPSYIVGGRFTGKKPSHCFNRRLQNDQRRPWWCPGKDPPPPTFPVFHHMSTACRLGPAGCGLGHEHAVHTAFLKFLWWLHLCSLSLRPVGVQNGDRGQTFTDPPLLDKIDGEFMKGSTFGPPVIQGLRQVN